MWNSMDSSFLSPAPLLTSVNGLRVGKRLGQDRTQLGHLTQTDSSNTSSHTKKKSQGQGEDRKDAHGYTISFPKQDKAC